MTEADLLQMLSRGEDSRHQFKPDATNADGMRLSWPTAAGTVFLGVAQPPE
jgi:ATP-dependent DNA helicase RecG